MKFTETLQAYTDACVPALWVTTFEEERIVNEIHTELKKLSPSDAQPTIYEWDCVLGLTLRSADPNNPHVIKDTSDPTKLFSQLHGIIKVKEDCVFILKDFHSQFGKEIKKAEYVCLMKKLLPALKNNRGTVIFVSCVAKIPQELCKDITLLDYKLPDDEEIRERLNYVLESTNEGRKNKLKIPADIADRAVAAARGLTATEIESAFSLSAVRSKGFNDAFVDYVFQEKIQQIKKSGGLTHIPTDIGFNDVGGLTEMKKWAKVRRHGFSQKAVAAGLAMPRGVGLSGFAGTGKTLSAKALAKEFGFPLFSLDLGSLFNKFVGETEANFNMVMKTIEALGPCVILIDEIEKYLSTPATSGSGDNGVSSRSFGSLLTWLNDRTCPAFIVFTTNNHTILPDALIRKGRFDDLFWIDLPNKVEREDIINIVIRKHKLDAKNFDIPALVKKTYNFTGVEIENLFIDAAYAAFDENKPAGDKHINKELENFKSQAMLKPENVEFLRNSVQGQLRLASIRIEEAEDLASKTKKQTLQPA